MTDYPHWSDLSLAMRDELHPWFAKLKEGISEFTFANLYLFRNTYTYRVTRISEGLYLFSGKSGNKSFFILPFGLPPAELISSLFAEFDFLKGASETQAAHLESAGYRIEEDRDNFDYLYLRHDLAQLNGKKFHKKRTHVNTFIQNYDYQGAFIDKHNVGDALRILDAWRAARGRDSDYAAAREALEKMDTLQICGSLVYADSNPVAYTIGEELAGGTSFAIHFEKALEDYKGAYQFINKCFASILPEQYITLNREQDLGDEGLRKAKLSYNPCGFIKKYRVYGRR